LRLRPELLRLRHDGRRPVVGLPHEEALRQEWGSSLGSIRASTWPDLEGTELLTLLSVIEQTVALSDRGSELLESVRASPLIQSPEFPAPYPSERAALIPEDEGDLARHVTECAT
jgi:hypothetical protein